VQTAKVSSASKVSATLEVIKETTSLGRRSQTPPEATLFDEAMVVSLCRKKEGNGREEKAWMV
jgi:hypothetical protein